ncbi:unnamed protein product [Ambrosiozyma monospora]|uniref:Unnamed protein product n=1 Tax=Ambrosiozyma monospora TaxID=43982 RepID=A0ACB5SXV4_AMBMO|nr:unnamed protein product [Ambrosiozyma monospora]
MSELARDSLLYSKFRPQILQLNEANNATPVQTAYYTYLSNFYLQLEKIQDTISKDDLTFALEQLDELFEYIVSTFKETPEVYHLSVEIDKLFAKNYVFVLSLMLKTTHEKFSIKLIDITNKLNDIIVPDVKKISMRSNWYFSIKHLAVVFLQYIFTKFSGFLNSFKTPLLTAIYRYLMKCHDNYNSSIENSIFKANYFTDMTMLVDIILSGDNSSNTLDTKTFTRLMKLSRAIVTRSTDGDYIYPLLSITHSRNFLVTLLKSDKYISTITTKKSVNNIHHYLSTISPYILDIISNMNTSSKKLRMSLSKNLSDLLVFNCIVYGANMDQDEKALEYSISVVMHNYMKESSTIEMKTGLLESLIQLIATLNLYYQTSSVSTKYINGVTFASLRVFSILNTVFHYVFGFGELTVPLKISSKETPPIVVDESTNLVIASKILRHMEIFYSFLIREVDSDINELILLGQLVSQGATDATGMKLQSLQAIATSSTQRVDNQWYILSLFKFLQLLITSLNEYVTTQHEFNSTTHEDFITQLTNKLVQLCKHNEFKIRVVSTETLIMILKIKPELSYGILNDALETITTSLDSNDKDKSFRFSEHHGLSFLISSILTYCPKSSISTDFVLRLYTVVNNFLKRFNSSLITTNLFASGGSIISNVNYEKQLVSWIMMMGLFNYATDKTGMTNSNFFLMESSQFLTIWKTLLAHSIPSNFVEFGRPDPSGHLNIKNLKEIMKLLEIKNHALSCLLGYINYLSSTKTVVAVHGQDASSLLTPDIAKQLNQIVNKSFTFMVNLKGQIGTVGIIPPSLDVAIKVNKLRIYESFLKLVPFLNLKNDLNSTLLIEVVNNFSDMYLFSHVEEQADKGSGKKKETPAVITDRNVYQFGDGLNYGLTSKISQHKVDELMIKTHQLLENEKTSKDSVYDIDLLPMHSFLSIESPYVKSHLTPVTVFDMELEALTFETIPHSFLNDHLLYLFKGSGGLGYTDNKKYPVNNITMTIDVSIEIFAISFVYLSVKVQQSIIETMRSSMFYKSKENKETSATLIAETLRRRAIMINSAVAIHGALSFINNHNACTSNAQSKLKISKTIALLLIETVKNMDTSDEYIAALNAESVGLCCSLVDETREEVLPNIQI